MQKIYKNGRRLNNFFFKYKQQKWVGDLHKVEFVSYRKMIVRNIAEKDLGQIQILKSFYQNKHILLIGMGIREMLGEDKNRFVFVDFGSMTYEGAMMSTRHGNFIPLSDVINKATEIATNLIEEKNPNLKNKNEIAKQVGIGAVIFGDLIILAPNDCSMA